MMKFKSLLVLLFMICFKSFGQTTLEDLYKADQYETIIELLGQKKNLSIEELDWLARSHGRIGEYSNGILYSEELMLRCLQEKDTVSLTKAINIKTENLVDLGRYDEGLEFCEENLHYFRPADSVEYQLLCFKLGMIHYHLGQYDEAYDTYNQITMPRFRELGLFTTNYSIVLMGKGEFDESIVYLNKSIQNDKKMGYSSCINYSNIALILMIQDKWDEAELYLDSASTAAHQSNSNREKKIVYTNYYDLYSNTGDITPARRYLDSISMINEVIFSQQLDEELIALQTSFEREHSLKKEIVVVDNERAYYQKSVLWAIIIALVSILILGGIITFLWIRNIKSQHQNILIEQKLLRSQMTPHFMFNSLSVLQGMILDKEDEASLSYLSKFSRLLRTSLENSRHKIVSLTDELTAVNMYIELQNLDASSPYSYELSVDEQINSNVIKIPPMLIQPFVENAIEHAFGSQKQTNEIKVKVKLDNDLLVCKIIDNGKGVNASLNAKTESKDKNSLATVITSERLAMLSQDFKAKGSVTVEDRSKFGEKGTLVTLHIPFKIDKSV